MCEVTPDKNITDADILAAASHLPDRQRLAFFLVVVKGISKRKAARTMGVRHAAVQRTLSRAWVNIRCAVEREILEEGGARALDDTCAG